MGVLDTTYTFTATDVVTSAKLNNVIDQTTFTATAITGTTLALLSGQLKVNTLGITSNELATNSVTPVKISVAGSTNNQVLTSNGTVASWQNTAAANFTNVKDFGAVGDGIVDDTTAIQNAFASGNSVFFPWGIYRCKDIVISGSKSAYCNGSIFKPAIGANWIFKLVGFRPQIFDAYFDGEEYVGNTGNIPIGLNNAGVIVGDNLLECELCVIQNCTWVNFAVCLIIGGNNTYSAAKGFITNCNFISYTQRGILLKKNALDFSFSNINIRSVLQIGTNGDIPKRGAIGFQHVGTATTSGKGGHLLNSVTCLNSEIGFQFTDSSLTTLQNCIGDGVAGAAYQISTTGSEHTDYIKFDNCFAGTAKIAYEITGTALKICVSNPTTIFSGVIPPWGGTDFFLTTGNYAVARDIHLQAGADLFVCGWFSDIYLNPFFAGTISFDSSDSLCVGADNVIGAGQTVYLTSGGNRNTEVLPFIAAKKGMIYGMHAQCGTASGAGQSFTYTSRVNSVDSGTNVVISGANVFAGSSNTITFFSQNDNVSIKLVTSGSAAQATHRVGLKVVYFG